MNICLLSELFYPYLLGGAEKRYYEVAKRLAKKHNVTVYSIRLYGQKTHEVHEGVEIRRFGLKHPLNKRSLPQLTSYFECLIKSLKSNFDIIDANQGIASYIGLLKPFTSKPVFATFHDIYWNDWRKYFRFPLSCIGKVMEFSWSKLKYDSIFTVSPQTKNKLIELGFRSKIEIIPSGIDLDFLNSINPEKDDNTIVYVGRLVKYKNLDKLLVSVSQVKKQISRIKLKIVGSGPEEFNLRVLAKKLDLNVEFLGFVSEEEKVRIIKSSSVLVNPSTLEGLGLVLIESMGCKTPIIARELDAYFFCNSKNSMLYENDGDLTNKILTLLTDKAMVSSMQKNGFETAKKFSWDEITKKIESVYLGCLNDKLC